ncbi:MAG: NAD(P)-binding protein [Desulfobacterales bacterium]
MKSYKYIIIGAGPSGLSFAHALRDLGETSFLVIEKEPVAGGLCRSHDVDGSPIDIGGGHFLDVKRSEVLDFLFRFMPRSEWQKYMRISTIMLRGKEIDYPLEANLWQLPPDDQIEFYESIAQAGCVRGETMPETFEDWIVWKLGKRIAAEYMLPYNRKIWSTDLNQLGTYWLHKLPNVSFQDTLRSRVDGQPHGTLPAHATFLYPKEYGYGEVWKRMGKILGDQLLTNTPIDSIDVNNRLINGYYRGETIITTIPWTLWPRIADVSPVSQEISKLQHVSIDIDYCSNAVKSKAHWVYEPDESQSYHRAIYRTNFCKGSRGYWTETNSRRSVPIDMWRYKNEYAYPLNTRDKPETIKKILSWAEQHSIIGLGRWGKWEHMNSDEAVSQAITAAKTIEHTKRPK